VRTLIFGISHHVDVGGVRFFYVFWACSHFSEFLQKFVEIQKKSMAGLRTLSKVI